MDEDWTLLLSFFPSNWRELASKTNALKGLRKNKSEENLLRTMLIHLGCGYSLRETAVRAKQAGLADLSDVALLKRLRKCKPWLCAMCQALFAEQGLALGNNGFRIRLFDGTNVKEPGKTGSLWRIHYSVQVPSLTCDHFKLTATEGQGVGESLTQFPVEPGDYIIADGRYCSATGIHHVAASAAYVTVRLSPQSIRLLDGRQRPFALLEELAEMKLTGDVKSWRVLIPDADNICIEGRVCAIRKSAEAIQLAHKKQKERASRKGQALRPETLIYAQYMIVLTTFPQAQFSAFEILEWYRIRWQIELVFKRFKQIASFGHLPKHDEESAKAWLYGKLFIALLTEKLIHYATNISPWGYPLVQPATTKPLA